MLRWKISPNPANALMPSWIRAPPESLRPMQGAPVFIARSITLHIFSAIVIERLPPLTVKSCAKMKTKRPLIVPEPATTPSPKYCFLSMPKSWQRWSLNISISSKEPLSNSSAIRSRAVYFPFSCCLSMAFSPPPRRALRRNSTNCFTFFSCSFIICNRIILGDKVTRNLRESEVFMPFFVCFQLLALGFDRWKL